MLMKAKWLVTPRKVKFTIKPREQQMLQHCFYTDHSGLPYNLHTEEDYPWQPKKKKMETTISLQEEGACISKI
jgi:hypothetical protein